MEILTFNYENAGDIRTLDIDGEVCECGSSCRSVGGDGHDVGCDGGSDVLSEDEHVRNALESCFPDLIAYLFRPGIQLGPYAGLLKLA